MLFHEHKISLPEAYERYISIPNPENQRLFLQSCFSYEFKDYKSDTDDIKRLYKSYDRRETNERAFVFSNGSSGGECSYYIGPHGFDLINNVEFFQRGCEKDGMLRLSTAYPERKRVNEVVNENYVVADFSSDECSDFISGFLEENPHKTHIEVAPNVFMMMNCHERLLDDLRKRSIRVITTSDDAYKTELFPSADRMIDWKTGCNFYECRHGSFHILPIWFEEDGFSHNILNLENLPKVPVADLLTVRGFSKCECGHTKCDMSLVSHFRHKPKSGTGYLQQNEIFGNLKGHYLNFQIIFRDKLAHILVDEFKKGTSEEDYEMVKGTLKPMGFSTTLERMKYAYLGRRKRPLIWLDEGQIIVEQF